MVGAPAVVFFTVGGLGRRGLRGSLAGRWAARWGRLLGSRVPDCREGRLPVAIFDRN